MHYGTHQYMNRCSKCNGVLKPQRITKMSHSSLEQEQQKNGQLPESTIMMGLILLISHFLYVMNVQNISPHIYDTVIQKEA